MPIYLGKGKAMKNFKMQFSHPVKGVLKLFKKGKNCAAHIIAVDTKESIEINISFSDIPKGIWNLALSWEFEEKEYAYHRIIAIG